ncbi:uncharacterized protein [Thunnus thynnus]|uniref:uncharacterized protein n=1 Tax=Thunnus thynnus TaxID=8237 RepID=UPI0035277A80
MSCANVMTNQDKCGRTSWLFVSKNKAVELINLGQIGENAKDKSDRLSVTVDCSLVINKISREDVGYYTCRQLKSGQQEVQDSRVYLSVVTMTEHKSTDMVMLSCSVSTRGPCTQTVKWVYEGNDQDVNTQHVMKSQSTCSAALMFATSHLPEKYSELFKCNVTETYTGRVQLFTLSSQSSGEDPTRAATTKSTPIKSTKTTKLPTTTSTPTTKSTTATMGKSTKAMMNQTAPTPTIIDTATKQQVLLRFIIVSVGLTALIIIIVSVNIWTRIKVNKTQMDDNAVHNDEDEDEGTVNYENVGEPSATVRLH